MGSITITITRAAAITEAAVEPAVEPENPPAGQCGLEGRNLVVSWDGVDGATEYNVNVTTDGKSSRTRAASGVSGSTVELTGVDSSATVHVAVQAVNSGGVGGWTDSLPVTPTT